MTANAVNEVRALEVVEADYIANSSGTGMVLILGVQFIDVPFNPYAQVLAIKLNLENTDETVQERGQRDFAALRRAVGVLNPQSTDELLFKPFRANISVSQVGRSSTVKEYIFDRGVA